MPYLAGEERKQLVFLPLVPGNERNWQAGWCTYDEHIGDSPDTEILCGGMNSKLPTAAAIWRQGNLLHFGFEQSPLEMNDNGRALIENSIVYIARFRDDRPLAHTPSPFVDALYPRPLRYLLRALQRDDAEPAKIAAQLAEPWSTRAAAMDLTELRAWIQAHQRYLCSQDGGKITVDEDALALNIPLGEPAFFDVALSALDDADLAARTIALLTRRVPSGPGAAATAAEWRAFLTAHRQFLFFLQEGGYLWHLDPLAKARGVPCDRLRGPARANS